ncbi:MAG: carboxypeptidase regulatory-like domain-containing protein [Candidatus Cloacimonetes bacterium]|nr:carboxypeptidase regulatory-like domain-containing protein [Candidatus Cloacimonadota bacterium]
MINIKKFITFIFVSILFVNISTLLGDGILFPNGTNINSHILTCPFNRDNDIILTDIPMDMYKTDESFIISWTPADSTCIFYYSSAPGGTNINNYTPSNGTGTGSIEICADDIGIGVGIYYCIVSNGTQDFTSVEFQLIVESSSGVNMNQPLSGEVIEMTTPTFSWDPNPGVPYYLLVLSDNPFTIGEDDEGNITVTGINPIWALITPDNSVVYGIQDPSGNFFYTAPPLVPGLEYNWIVLNNYGNDPLLTSDVTSTPFGFTFETPNPIEAPELISPENTTTDSSEYITFEWTVVEEAMTYQIFLSEIRIEQGSEVQYPVWDQVTTNTLFDFNASAILTAARYAWKVIATDEDGISACSEVFEFTYDIDIFTLDLTIKNPDNVGIGFAHVEIDPIEGSGDNIPLTVGPSGYEEKILPLGNYIVTASKDGYETQDDTVTVTVPDTTIGLTIILHYSECFFYGSVVDSIGNLVENSTINAESTEGEIRSTTSNTGNYNIAVTPGFWTITADKEGYALESPIESYIDIGDNILLENLTMLVNEKDLQGTVLNTSGVPLSGVTITATKGIITRTKTTNSSGLYQFFGLDIGEWSIYAEKPGYYTPGVTIVEIFLSTPSPIILSDIITPQANIVSGNANNGMVGLENVEIKATPSSGSPLSTFTNSYGDHTINLPSGNYVFTAILEGYTSQNTHQLNLTVGETINGINFELNPNESYIEGTVISSGVGLEGVTVTAGENQSITNNIGAYSILVSPGTYTVSATKTGYTSSGSQTGSIGAGQTVQGINFVMMPNASVISGKVTHAGVGIANAQIKGYKISTGVYITEITSEDNGNYVLNLFPGEYKIWAEKSNFICGVGDTLDVYISSGQTIPNQNIVMTPFEAYITGTTRKTNGDVLRNVSISVEEINNPSNSYSTVSGIYGNFSLIVAPQVEYKIVASKTGYSSAEIETGILGLEGTFSAVLTLSGLPSSFSGRVYDEYGSPLGKATVKAIRNGSSYETTTLTNGSYSLGISPGEYDITASKLGYLPSSTTEHISPGSQIDTIYFHLQENFATLQGLITDSETGIPIENALISANLAIGGGGIEYSNSSGYYLIEDLLPGLYSTITISKADYETEILENQYLVGGEITIKDIQLTHLTSILEVNVVSSNPKLALNNVTISVENGETGAIVSAVTNTQGYCQLTGLASNVQFIVTPGKINYFDFPDTCFLFPDTTQIINFEMQLISATISGNVVDEDSTALSNVFVSAVSPDGFSGSTTTNPLGTYKLQNLNPNRNYIISLTLPGYTDAQPDTIPLFTDVLEGVVLEMIPNDKVISGIITDQTDDPLSDVRVTASAEAATSEDYTDSNGEFSIPSLAPFETYLVATNIFQQGWENTSINAEILADDINIGTLEMKIHTSKFLGEITDNNTDLPVAGATVIAQDDANTYTATSQPDGFFEISLLYAGTYDITVIKESYETKTVTKSVGHKALKLVNISIDPVAIVSVSVSGDLKDTNDRPIGLTQINLFNDQQTLVDTTLEDGSFVFPEVFTYTTTFLNTNLDPLNYNNVFEELNIQEADIDTVLRIDIHSAKVFGIITSSINEAELSNVQVKLYNKEDDIYYEIASDITQSDGYYEFTYLYEGDYKIDTYRPGYTDSTFSFSLDDFEEKVFNFHLMPKGLTIFGVVKDTLGLPLEGAIIKVSSNDKASNGQNILSKDVYFDTTGVDGLYAITVDTIGDYSLIASKEQYTPSDTIDVALPSLQDYFEQDFVLNPVILKASIHGKILVYDESTGQNVPPTEAVLKLQDSSGDIIEISIQSPDSLYEFNGLLIPDIFSLEVTVYYLDQEFYEIIPEIEITEEDTVYQNFNFTYYILCSIQFNLTEDGTIPIDNATISITSAKLTAPLWLFTDSTGFCSTDTTLYTGDYTVKITKSMGSYGRFIEAGSYTISGLSPHIDENKQLPLQFDESQLNDKLSSDIIELILRKAESYTDPVYLHYYDVDNNYNEVEMEIDDTLFTYEIPQQEKSGKISFWFTSYSEEFELNFSNATSPYELIITSEGVLSQDDSRITPSEPVFAYNQDSIFEVNLLDDVGNSLDDLVDSEGSVQWTLTDTTIGNIFSIPGEIRKIDFSTPVDIEGNLSGKIKAIVTLEGVTITLENNIYVKDMHLNKLSISGVDETSNDNSCFFTVSALSDSGWAMTVPVEWDSIPTILGSLQEQSGGVLYTPDQSFIGQFYLNAKAYDPSYGDEISTSKQITVYKKLNINNPQDILYSGKGCNLTLPELMLTTGSAKIYLKSVSVPPMKKVGLDNELKGDIFNVISDKSIYTFDKRPGIIFEIEEGVNLENIYIAYWDNSRLKWIKAESGGKGYRDEISQLSLESIPGWHEYGVVGISDKLGIYDLKLLPNPFTPNDKIGENMGLQISFSISSNIGRYVNVTAKVYNLNGTLVRTIRENQPMMKGQYKIGEEQTLYWDGKTDNGKMARNGRYVIQLIAEDAKHTEEVVKTIVLIK